MAIYGNKAGKMRNFATDYTDVHRYLIAVFLIRLSVYLVAK
jgi:hypothetical protein